jgi:hypothetical protein
MKKILLITRFNDQEDEDILLSESLSKYFEVIVSNPFECHKFEDKVDLILVRNIWPLEDYLEKWNKIALRWKKKNLKVYNDLCGKADIKGKNYLVELYKNGFEVIPSIRNIKDINKLPKSEFYFIKPLHGGGSIGVEKLSKKQLLKRKLKNYIIQPYLYFKYETSFYFIDKKFQYELTDNKKDRWNLKYYFASLKDKSFAKRFANWNQLKYGIQRIDACRTKEGKLLLMEIEDFCPYLSLQDISPRLRNKFVKNLIKSIGKRF